MDDIYQHPVFFECHNLSEEQIRKVENYFLIRRKSGGGDHGPLRRVTDDVYCIEFKSQKGRFTRHVVGYFLGYCEQSFYYS